MGWRVVKRVRKVVPFRFIDDRGVLRYRQGPQYLCTVPIRRLIIAVGFPLDIKIKTCYNI